VLGFLSLFSGGGLTRMAIFGLGIMPYITSSIIMQVLGRGDPQARGVARAGRVGQKKITQWTRYVTVVLALLQATGLAFLFHNGGGGLFGDTAIDLIPDFTVPRVMLIVLSLTAGVALLMWMGELITQRGIGNGMSLLIFASVVSSIPFEGGRVKAENGNLALFGVILVGLAVLVAIVFVEQGQRRIPVQFAKRVVGRKMFGGQSSYIPLKVNQSGVIPVIFASSMLYLPVLLTNVLRPAGSGTACARGSTQPAPAGQPGVHLHLRRDDRVLRLLLHGDHVRPGQAGRHHPQAGRLHPRDPPRSPDRAATWPRSCPASPCPGASSSPRSRCCRRSSSTCGASRSSRASAASRCSSPWAWPSRR
jgi:preprotein translocase subunit SecY